MIPTHGFNSIELNHKINRKFGIKYFHNIKLITIDLLKISENSYDD